MFKSLGSGSDPLIFYLILFFIFYFLSILCLPRLHLFDRKYSNTNSMKYYSLN